MNEAWQTGIQFLGQLFTGQVPAAFIIILVISFLLNFSIDYIYEMNRLTDLNPITNLLKNLIESTIETLAFIYFFIAFIHMITVIPFLKIIDTSTLAIGEMTLICFAVYSVFNIPSIMIMYAPTMLGRIFYLFGQVIIGGLIYYLLLIIMPLHIPFNTPLIIGAFVLTLIGNLIIWSAAVAEAEKEKSEKQTKASKQ